MKRCEAIRQRWPLRAMAARLGVELPRDGVKFRHPFRPDAHPSCTVRGERFYDWSRDPRGTDAIGFFALAKGVAEREAIALLWAELPASHSASPAPRETRPVPPPAQPPARPPFARLETPTEAELAELAERRKIFPDALRRAAQLGHLFTADSCEGRCHVVTDSTRQVFQSRLLSGEPWRHLQSKAWTTVAAPGLAGWPLGAAEVGARPQVILCEGGPDWLVAHEAEPELAVCAMLGATQRLPASALPYLAGKRVRILAHGDAAGRAAARTWATQLAEVGADVRAVPLQFDDARDLNDLTSLPLERWRHHQLHCLLCP